MKLALVYDRVNKWGGAERVLLALHEIWPEAPLYTAVYNPKGAEWAQSMEIRPSFLQKMPVVKEHHEWFPWLMPLAFESFSFDEFDVVLSVTSAEAKNIITKPNTLHICYCLTPTRYLWSGFSIYKEFPGMGLMTKIARSSLIALGPKLRRWDLIASSRPDCYLAISKLVERRIHKYYRRKVEKIIYPPVDLNKFTINKSSREDYFLVVSRLVGYKRIDLIIEAFNRLGWPLVIVGDGLARRELESKAKGNITFVGGNLTDDELVNYYQNCRAFISCADEDFGLAAVEAQACGAPVIALLGSGIAEIIKNKETGLLVDKQDVKSILDVLKQFTKTNIVKSLCRENVIIFGQDYFLNQMKTTVESLYERYLTNTL